MPTQLITSGLAAVAACALAVGVVNAAPARADPGPGQFCSLSKQSYYEQHGYICKVASDGRYRLFKYSGGSSGGGGGGSGSGGGGTEPVTGPSISFAPRTQTSGCQFRDRGALPDRDCTPGAYFAKATRAKVCQPGWSERVRDVSDSMKEAVYREYGIRSHHQGQYEVDHLVPLEDGGSNSIANLFPEAAKPLPGFHQKDALENRTHEQICDGSRSLRATQRQLARNWLVLYRAEY